jgi:hypothetical protein
LLAAIPAAIGGYMLVVAARIWFGARDPSFPPVLWVGCGLAAPAIGLPMAGVANLILLARRWDYSSADGRAQGWVQTILGRVFEAEGTHRHVTAVSAPPAADRLDSAVLAEPWCGVALGLTMTVLGMAARGAVDLHIAERRHLRRPPNWPLCWGWLRARTVPEASAAEPIVEISAASVDREVRSLERDLYARLPPVELVEVPAPHFRQAAAVLHAGAPMELRSLLVDVVADAADRGPLRDQAAHDTAPTSMTDATSAQRSLAACRVAAPALIDLIERDASMAAASSEDDEATSDLRP